MEHTLTYHRRAVATVPDHVEYLDLDNSVDVRLLIGGRVYQIITDRFGEPQLCEVVE
jgi:hypothetical protein